jgi:hypothetical protein
MNNELSISHIEHLNRDVICSNDINTNSFNDIYNDNIRDNIREYSDKFDSSTNNISSETIHEKNYDINNKNVNIYRYKFTHQFIDDLLRFSKIHQYDNKKDFKEAWDIWVNDNEEIIEQEVRILQNLGYNGDIKNKMFKSSRYYFRKKSTEKKEPKQRRDYVPTNKELLESMDNHIKNNILDKNYKPSDGFEDFCKNNVELLKKEVNILIQYGFTNSDDIKKKIKKTYKNRHFLINK